MRKKTSPSKRNIIYGIGFYKKIIVFATAVVTLTTAIIILINTCNPRSNTSPLGSQNVEVTVNPVISPVIVNDIKIYSSELPPSSHEGKTSDVPEIVQVTSPLPPPESEYIKILVPKRWGSPSSGSAFGGNVQIDLEKIDKKDQARVKIKVFKYDQQGFSLGRHSPPVEIDSYSIKVVDTGNDYAEFCITRME